MCLCVCVWVCVCVGGGGGCTVQPGSSPDTPVWPHWHPRAWLLHFGVGLAGLGIGACPRVPLTQCNMKLGQEPSLLPQDRPRIGVVAPWLPPGQLHRFCPQACHCDIAPCVVCVMGQSWLVVLAAARRPPQPTQFGNFPIKDACVRNGAAMANGTRGNKTASIAYSIRQFS